MMAYRKFSDTLKNQNCTPTPPKAPKAPKTTVAVSKECGLTKNPRSSEGSTLDTLGALGGVASKSRNSAGTAESRAPSTWTDAHEEHAAIAEHDGGAPRAWAEALARLDPASPPGDVPPQRWGRFLDDCGRFLDQGWAEQCNALGWRPLDLFGCDRERPWARIDHAGLLWLLDGRKLVALTANTATMEAATGSRQTYYRKPIEPGCVVLAWELRP